MTPHTALVILGVQILVMTVVQSAEQQLQLSDSYLPVAMQIIAHLTDQMGYESRDDVTPSTAKPTTPVTTTTTTQSPYADQPSSTTNGWWTTAKPGSTTNNGWWTPSKPASTTNNGLWTTKPTSNNGWWTTAKPGSTTNRWSTTAKPGTTTNRWSTTAKPGTTINGWWTPSKPGTTTPNNGLWNPFKPGSNTNNGLWTTGKPGSATTINGWWISKRPQETTPFHRPGLYAPFSPPKPFYNRYQSRDFLLPMYNAQYTVLGPEETRSEDPFLAIHEEEVKPLIDPSPDSLPLLPAHFDVKISSRSDGFLIDDISEESLQYLSDDVRHMIKMAKDPQDERVVDVWERSGPQPTLTKAKMSSSNLRLLLLYDLLSRDAKRQKLSDFHGFSPKVMKVLVDSSSAGARAQLRMALDNMVQRKDCGHDYANNRAREMVEELGKDESKLSSELRYLQPLVYKY